MAPRAGAEGWLRKTRETAPREVVAAQDAWKAQERRTSDIAEAAPEDLVWADGYIFSAPTRYGGAASQIRAFIDNRGDASRPSCMLGPGRVAPITSCAPVPSSRRRSNWKAGR